MSQTHGFKLDRQDIPGGVRMTPHGSIDEFASFGVATDVRAGALEIDLSDVMRCNSVGLINWVRFLKGLSPHVMIKFVKCSPVIVRQLNVFSALFSLPRLEVASFFVTFVCSDCGKERDVLLETQVIRKGKSDIDVPTPPLCDHCGMPTEFEEMPEKQFLFLQRA